MIHVCAIKYLGTLLFYCNTALFILYGFKIRSVTFSEEHTLGVDEVKMRPKGEEVRGKWGEKHAM